jgi:hypothetical protein
LAGKRSQEADEYITTSMAARLAGSDAIAAQFAPALNGLDIPLKEQSDSNVANKSYVSELERELAELRAEIARLKR